MMKKNYAKKGTSKARRKATSPLRVKSKPHKTIGSPSGGRMIAKSSNNLRRG